MGVNISFLYRDIFFKDSKHVLDIYEVECWQIKVCFWDTLLKKVLNTFSIPYCHKAGTGSSSLMTKRLEFNITNCKGFFKVSKTRSKGTQTDKLNYGTLFKTTRNPLRG